VLERGHEQLAKQLEEQRGRSGRLARELEAERKQRGLSPLPVVASVVFLPGTGGFRSAGGAPKRIVIPSEGLVELRVRLNGDKFNTYRIVLRPVSGGDAIWDQSGLKAQFIQGKAVLITVPTSSFTVKGTKDYIFSLNGSTEEKSYQEIDQYYFQVVK
jgi:hypothetical protein